MGIQTRNKEKYTPGGVLKCNKRDQGWGGLHRESEGAGTATLVTKVVT